MADTRQERPPLVLDRGAFALERVESPGQVVQRPGHVPELVGADDATRHGAIARLDAADSGFQPTDVDRQGAGNVHGEHHGEGRSHDQHGEEGT